MKIFVTLSFLFIVIITCPFWMGAASQWVRIIPNTYPGWFWKRVLNPSIPVLEELNISM